MQLVIDTPGTLLRRENALLEIQHQGTKHRLTPDKIDSIILSRGVMLTTDALLLALAHDIDVVLTDGGGTPRGRLWNNKFGSISTIRRQQITFSQAPEGMDWVRQRLIQKIGLQMGFLYQVRYGLPEASHIDLQKIDRSLRAMGVLLRRIQHTAESKTSPLPNAATMRGWEGTASRHYFQSLSLALPAAYRFETRTRRPARDVFNCILNYLYGMLYALVESALLRAGIDPSLGIWHADEYNKPVLSYDFIEPYRVWADAIAFRLCQSYSLTLSDTIPHESGLWLAGSGKRIVVQTFNDYMQEVIPYQERRRSRLTNIQLDAHDFAQMLLKYKPGAAAHTKN